MPPRKEKTPQPSRRWTYRAAQAVAKSAIRDISCDPGPTPISSNNQFISRIDVLKFKQYFMDIVRVSCTLEDISDDLEDMLDALRVVNVHVRKIISAGRAAALKRKLKVSVAIESFKTFRDRIAGNGLRLPP